MFQITNHTTRLAAGLALCGAASFASASTFPSTVFTFTATSSNGTGSYDIELTDGDVFFDGQQVFWQATSDIAIWNNAATVQVGTIRTGTTVQMYSAFGVAGIDFNFSLYGDANADTIFSLSSGILGGLGYTNAEAFASGTMIVGDSNNNGAEVRGLQPAGRFLTASINGITFADLIDGVTFVDPNDPDVGNITVGPTSTGGDSEDTGPVLYGPVSSLELHYLFEVTAGDQAGGTSTIFVFPTPATTALLGLGGLVAARRRRA